MHLALKEESTTGVLLSPILYLLHDSCLIFDIFADSYDQYTKRRIPSLETGAFGKLCVSFTYSSGPDWIQCLGNFANRGLVQLQVSKGMLSFDLQLIASEVKESFGFRDVYIRLQRVSLVQGICTGMSWYRLITLYPLSGYIYVNL